MKIKVWKLYFFDLDHNESYQDLFDGIGIYTEKELRARLKQAIDDESFGQGVCEYYEVDKMTDKQIDTMPIDEIVDIFRDDGYAIKEFYIEI